MTFLFPMQYATLCLYLCPFTIVTIIHTLCTVNKQKSELCLFEILFYKKFRFPSKTITVNSWLCETEKAKDINGLNSYLAQSTLKL